MRKFKPAKRPCIEPVEWTIDDSKSAGAAPASTGTDIDAVRFVVKDGVRHVYISSLDELRHRLDLDETREAGVAEEDVQAEKKKQSGDKRKRDPASGQRKRGVPKTPGAARESDIGLDIDEEKLSRNVYSGSPAHRSVRAKQANGPPKQIDPRPVASVLQRQEVREVFGADLTALNEVIFQQAEENALEPVELNADVELLIESLSARLTEDSSRAYLRQFASLVRDPLGEDREQSETEAHTE